MVSSKTVMLSLKQKRFKKFCILRVFGIIILPCPVASIFHQKQITSEKFGKSGFSKSRFFKKLNPSKK
nr:MAG TPA: hypothetical protein [Caudoviricetes sp.]